MKPAKIGQLATGEEVFDRKRDPIMSVKPPEITQLLPDLLARTRSQGEYHLAKEYPFFFQTGMKYCVEVSKKELDRIYYAQMVDRTGYSRFVRERQPEPTNKLVVILSRVDDYYVLRGFYPGDKSYPEPWQKDILLMASKNDPDIINKSWSFWKKHAFVKGYRKIYDFSIVKRCPWTKINLDSADL